MSFSSDALLVVPAKGTAITERPVPMSDTISYLNGFIELDYNNLSQLNTIKHLFTIDTCARLEPYH